MNVIDLSRLRKTEPDAEPELAEEITVQTFKLPRIAQPAPRISLAVVELTGARRVDLSMHQEGLCIFFEATGEQTRVMPVEQILKGWLPVFVQTDVMPPVDVDAADPVTARIHADRVAHTADEAPITLEPTP